MRVFFILSIVFFSAFQANAQSEKAKERFMKQLFNDFKKNRLDLIEDRFVDSVFLDELINESKKLQEMLTKKYSNEKIHKQRLVAKKRFVKSLQRAYDKFTSEGLEEKLRDVKPEMKIYAKRTEPIANFGIKYSFYLDDNDGSMNISKISYDKKRKRFVILSDRVRAYLIQADAEISSMPTEVREYEKVRIDDDVAMPDIAKPIKDLKVAPIPRGTNRPVAEPRWERKKIEKIREEVDIENVGIAEVREEVRLSPPPPPPVKSEDEVFQFVEQMPEFPGGNEAMMRFITKNINYPPKAREAGLQGRVYAQFVVGKDGVVRDIEIIRGIGHGCDQEAIRVIKKMPKWKPGRQRGRVVPVRFTLPFSFKLR